MNMKVLIEVLLYVWQLPQNLLGLLLFWWYGCGCKSSKGNYVTYRIMYSEKMHGGISLGRYGTSCSLTIISAHHRAPTFRKQFITNMVTHGSRFISGGYICLPLVCRLLRGLGCILHSSVSAPSVIMTSTPRSGLTGSAV